MINNETQPASDTSQPSTEPAAAAFDLAAATLPAARVPDLSSLQRTLTPEHFAAFHALACTKYTDVPAIPPAALKDLERGGFVTLIEPARWNEICRLRDSIDAARKSHYDAISPLEEHRWKLSQEFDRTKRDRDERKESIFASRPMSVAATISAWSAGIVGMLFGVRTAENEVTSYFRSKAAYHGELKSLETSLSSFNSSLNEINANLAPLKKSLDDLSQLEGEHREELELLRQYRSVGGIGAAPTTYGVALGRAVRDRTAPLSPDAAERLVRYVDLLSSERFKGDVLEVYGTMVCAIAGVPTPALDRDNSSGDFAWARQHEAMLRSIAQALSLYDAPSILHAGRVEGLIIGTPNLHKNTVPLAADILACGDFTPEELSARMDIAMRRLAPPAEWFDNRSDWVGAAAAAAAPGPIEEMVERVALAKCAVRATQSLRTGMHDEDVNFAMLTACLCGDLGAPKMLLPAVRGIHRVVMKTIDVREAQQSEAMARERRDVSLDEQMIQIEYLMYLEAQARAEAEARSRIAFPPNPW